MMELCGRGHRTWVHTTTQRYCAVCKRKNARDYVARLRKKAIEKLGGQCIRCGESDWRVLQIDHIEGGGWSERCTVGSAGVSRNVLAGKSGYQLLCANDNWRKKYESDENRERID